MQFYLAKGLKDHAKKLLNRIKELKERLENLEQSEKVRKDQELLIGLKRANYYLNLAFSMYYHAQYDAQTERKYLDAALSALKELYEQQEFKAKVLDSNEYFTDLLRRDVLDVVMGKNLRQALDQVIRDSEDAFNYSYAILIPNLQLIMVDYLIASAYLGKLDNALKLINNYSILKYSFSRIIDVIKLTLYILFSYFVNREYLPDVRDLADKVAGTDLPQDDFILSDKTLGKMIQNSSRCPSIIVNLLKRLTDTLRLDESKASNLIYQLLVNINIGIVALLALSKLLVDLETAKEIANCMMRTFSMETVTKLLREIAESNSEDEFKVALVKLAIYLF